MANDRVYIECTGCGERKMLLKFFPQTGSKSRDNGVLDWLDGHAECHSRFRSGDLGGDPGFRLFTESAGFDVIGTLFSELDSHVCRLSDEVMEGCLNDRRDKEASKEFLKLISHTEALKGMYVSYLRRIGLVG